jgi:ribonuclease HI
MDNEPIDHLTIYTDGSCCELANISSCAFYIPKLGEKKAWVLSKYTTSFNAELAAMKQALQHIYPLDWQDITIFADSKSSIQVISSFKWESGSLI